MKRRRFLPDVEFVVRWQRAASLKAALRAIGGAHNTVTGRARKLRREGVPLKKFKAHYVAEKDIPALARLARKTLKETR